MVSVGSAGLRVGVGGDRVGVGGGCVGVGGDRVGVGGGRVGSGGGCVIKGCESPDPPPLLGPCEGGLIAPGLEGNGSNQNIHSGEEVSTTPSLITETRQCHPP